VQGGCGARPHWTTFDHPPHDLEIGSIEIRSLSVYSVRLPVDAGAVEGLIVALAKRRMLPRCGPSWSPQRGSACVGSTRPASPGQSPGPAQC
jgi:hypothetical protein